MKIKTKVTLATVGVATLSSFVVGAAGLAVNYNSGIQQIRQQLGDAISLVENSNEDAVTTAQLAVSGREITLAFVQSDGLVTVLQDSAGNLNDQAIVKREMALADGEKLIFAGSKAAVIESTKSSLILTLLLASLVATIGIITSWFVLKTDLRNLKRITIDAQKIASGNLTELKTLSGSSEIGELSGALSELVDKLQESNIRMQEFLGDASHELRTPLTVIRGYLELLEKNREISSDQSSRAISRAHQEALRMQMMISDILLLAELGEERVQPMAQVQLEEIFLAQIEDLRIQNPKREIEIISNQHSPCIGADELLIRFMQNALSNIRRYTPEDARVKVSIVQSPVGFEINIDDAGPGIPELSGGRQITAFRRFDESRSRGLGGSGLGLSIMSKIIERHGGEMLLAESNLGGLRVSAFLPN